MWLARVLVYQILMPVTVMLLARSARHERKGRGCGAGTWRRRGRQRVKGDVAAACPDGRCQQLGRLHALCHCWPPLQHLTVEQHPRVWIDDLDVADLQGRQQLH